ncbi:hypothetical protein KP509_21G071100 [Ceratopteris richardii]|nr:hypothetical protein KP509_21G071100 [Ceratopteris richardii]
MQKREARKLEIEEGIGMTAAESRFLLVHQYLQDQLDTITQHLHVHAGDSDSLLDLHPVAPRSSIADDFDHSPHSAFSSIHDSGCLRRTRTG